jgi:hypothetical protein
MQTGSPAVQQSSPGAQQAPAHTCDSGQQVSSPVQMLPSEQQALSQHCADVWQQVGPHLTPDGQTHWPLLQT